MKTFFSCSLLQVCIQMKKEIVIHTKWIQISREFSWITVSLAVLYLWLLITIINHITSILKIDSTWNLDMSFTCILNLVSILCEPILIYRFVGMLFRVISCTYRRKYEFIILIHEFVEDVHSWVKGTHKFHKIWTTMKSNDSTVFSEKWINMLSI